MRRGKGWKIQGAGWGGGVALEPQQLHVESGNFLLQKHPLPTFRPAFVRTQDTWMHMHLHTEQEKWVEIEDNTLGKTV